MASSLRADGHESGTGQDTHLGVCPCPALHPCVTWRDIVPSCPAVPHHFLVESEPDWHAAQGAFAGAWRLNGEAT